MQEANVLVMGNSNTTASDPYQGCTMGHVPLSATKPDKGENFLDAPNPSPLQSKLPSPIPFHYGWPMGRDRGLKREGGKSSTIILKTNVHIFPVGVFSSMQFTINLSKTINKKHYHFPRGEVHFRLAPCATISVRLFC